MQFHSNPDRESDPHALPDCEVFQLTAREVATQDEDLVYEYGKRQEFKLYRMNSTVREHMIDTIVAEEELRGGWFYWYCFPGCLPDSSPIGPFESMQEAIDDCRANNDEEVGEMVTAEQIAQQMVTSLTTVASERNVSLAGLTRDNFNTFLDDAFADGGEVRCEQFIDIAYDWAAQTYAIESDLWQEKAWEAINKAFVMLAKR